MENLAYICDKYCKCGDKLTSLSVMCRACYVEHRLNDKRKNRRTKREEVNWRGVEKMFEGDDRNLLVLSDLMNIIQKNHRVSLSRMKEKTRWSEVKDARFHFYWFVDYLRGKIFWMEVENQFIGWELGQDHSMFYHGVRKVIPNYIYSSRDFREFHQRVLSEVNQIIEKWK